jgi:two-component system CheB/CheR fusion protein
MRKNDGTLDCILVLVQDITERKRLEAELASVAQFPRENPNPVLRLGDDGRPLFLNDAAEAWLVAEGWKRGAPVPSQLREAIESVMRGSAPGEFDLPHGDGCIYSFYCVPVPEKEYANLYGRDVTEARRAEEELRAAKNSADRAKAVAELANRAKDYFLAVLSHELRTPLAPVVMGVSMLQDRPDLDQDVRETLGMVRRNAEMEARLIDDLLDITRISRGTVELQKQRVDLGMVIDYAVEVCRPDIEARGLEFGVEMGPNAPYWVEADITRLQQVFWNLLKNSIKFTPHEGCVNWSAGALVRPGNAIKFTPHGGGVDIRCRLDGREHVVVEVSDNGIGIDPEALPRLFNAFEQAERSISRQFGGLGLGLAISKAMVQMHGGSIEAHSEGRGKGATFRVRLPLCAPPGEAESLAPATPRKRAVGPLRILLVEDHGVTAKLMCQVLAADGHEVEAAGDIATALELADRHRFDLLLSDLGLPDGSGHDLMRELRSRGHKFPGIALSGYGQAEDILRSQEAGFAAHLTKPVARERLVESIASVMSALGD